MSEKHLTLECPPLPSADGVEYRHLPGWPGYAVGSDGSVLCCKLRGHGRRINSEWRQLKASIGNCGYPLVSLSNGQSKTTRHVHRLVLEAFLGPCPEGKVCRHLDGTRQNNIVENLTWGTGTENQLDRVRHGTSNRGSAQKNSRLQEHEVRDIRKRLKNGEVGYMIAKAYGVSAATISAIRTRQNWAWLEEADRLDVVREALDGGCLSKAEELLDEQERRERD